MLLWAVGIVLVYSLGIFSLADRFLCTFFGFRLAQLGLVSSVPTCLFWLLVLTVLYVFYCIKNNLALTNIEEKEKHMNKNLHIMVLSFFDTVSTAIMGLVVNSVSGATPLT
ncbi:hypothetical protein A2I42_11140 [Salmonella enterica]|uniref:Uncharacterized protein n=1 Tax=Salmonella enterica TaxID=28901 RepID=A0A3V9C685_SALER|nr:hypothetical protein [Salmonella enterica subsp. enterica serovar Redlands]EAA8667686.1 hypothetical protein [Salmonella enterica]EBW8696969.1 hypothetical protein [Salmonella enterica subsp. diarizonae serovar 16:z10:e,n,x,z15]EAA9292042.1 hypothetical protein [Salmonella enterica]EAA9926685.1 hypothetical protein [Salmonella enterica]